ncbi:MAG: response regulator transcription factor [Acidimicrobiales bacterium]
MTERNTVLVVDDERPLRLLLRTYLEKEGYDVVEADNGLEALSVLRRRGADIALVDLMLPGLDGLELVRRIRAESAVPVIMLTARGEETNRVAGLEVGADDYVVKPFSPPEIVARVRANLRRAQGLLEKGQVVRAGTIELDRSSRRCLVGGQEIDLTRREFDLLATLVESAGRVRTREQLLDAVWGTPFLGEKTVDVHVASLRRKLGDGFRLTAMRGVGYRLEA